MAIISSDWTAEPRHSAPRQCSTKRVRRMETRNGLSIQFLRNFAWIKSMWVIAASTVNELCMVPPQHSNLASQQRQCFVGISKVYVMLMMPCTQYSYSNTCIRCDVCDVCDALRRLRVFDWRKQMGMGCIVFSHRRWCGCYCARTRMGSWNERRAIECKRANITASDVC